MKGIILAGGSGTRLYPLTHSVSKQLLPVYDKPLIHYPLATMLMFGVTDILIISTPRDIPQIQDLLGDGSLYGARFIYKVQEHPRGIAEAFLIGEDFIGSENVCLLLGDNIFFITNDFHELKQRIDKHSDEAFVFGYHVEDPERFGVLEISKDNGAFHVLSIEEKPKHPKSHYAATGLYFYPNDVVAKAKNLKPSSRGELEITDINNLYVQENRIQCEILKRGSVWVDAGTPKSLMKAAKFIESVEDVQALKLSCLEEVAYRSGLITKEDLKKIAETLKAGSDYKRYLDSVLAESEQY